MATEKNPFEQIPEEISNVIEMPQAMEEGGGPSFFAEDDGGVTVDFTETTIEMEAEESIQEWYGDITDKLEDEEQEEVAANVVNSYTSDKESRGEWEAMFEKGFDY